MLGLKTSLGVVPGRTLAELLMDQAICLNDSPAGVTFTRNSGAFDPYNVTQSLTATRRRRTYSLGRFRAIGFDMIEGAVTSSIPAGLSEHFELANGGINHCTIGTGITAPDGTPTACHIQEADSSSESHFPAFNEAFVASTTYAVSVFCKAAERSWCAIGLSSSIFTGGATCWFNLATGATGNATAGCTTSMVAVPNKPGWWKCIIVFTCTTSNTAGIFLYTSTGNGVITYAGTAGSGHYAWGLMCTPTAFASSYASTRNLQTNSNKPSSWSNNAHVTITANSIANPITGAVDANLITEDSSLSAIIEHSFSSVLSSGATLTDSIYLKAGTATWVLFQVSNSGLTSGFQGWVNLATGAAGTFQVIGGGTATGMVVTAVPNQPGWYRISITGVIGAFATGVVILHSASANGSSTRVANATWYLYGNQPEYGTAATTYWQTDAAVGGRDADLLSMTYALGTVGTILALVIPYGWTGDQGGASYRTVQDPSLAALRIERASSTTLKLRRVDAGGAEEVNPFTPGLANGVLSHIAIVWDATSVRGFLNGVANGTPDSSLTPPYVTATTLQSGAAGTEFFGWVCLLGWSRALAASELLALYDALPVAA